VALFFNGVIVAGRRREERTLVRRPEGAWHSPCTDRFDVHIPFFREHREFPRPCAGPLLGRRVLVIVAPVAADVRGVRDLFAALHPLGVRVAVTMECHGEAHGEDGGLLFPDQLLVEVEPAEWDALVLAGGRGADTVAEDPLARGVTRRFAESGRTVAAIGRGSRVLAAARVEGGSVASGRDLAEALAGQWGWVRRSTRVPAGEEPHRPLG
jgi:hypothetical protein